MLIPVANEIDNPLPSAWIGILDAATGSPLSSRRTMSELIFPGHVGAFSSDGNQIIAASGQLAQVWSLKTAISVAQRSVPGAQRVGFFPNGSAFAIVDTRIYPAKPLEPLGPPRGFLFDPLDFSTGGLQAILPHDNPENTVIWDSKGGHELKTLAGHKGRVVAASFSRDEKLLATASQDKTARIWDITTGTELQILKGHRDHVTSVQFSQDDTRIVTTSLDGTTRVWDRHSGVEFKLFEKPPSEWAGFSAAAFSPDAKQIVTGTSGGAYAQVWDVSSGEPIRTRMYHHEINYIRSVLFSPDGKRIATVGGNGMSGGVAIWDVASGDRVGYPIQVDRQVDAVHFSPDSMRIVTACENGSSRVWDALTGLPLGEPMAHEGRVKSAKFSVDGTHVLTLPGGEDTLRRWRLPELLPNDTSVIEQFLMIRTMAKVGANGEIQEVPVESWIKLRERMREEWERPDLAW